MKLVLQNVTVDTFTQNPKLFEKLKEKKREIDQMLAIMKKINSDLRQIDQIAIKSEVPELVWYKGIDHKLNDKIYEAWWNYNNFLEKSRERIGKELNFILQKLPAETKKKFGI